MAEVGLNSVTGMSGDYYSINLRRLTLGKIKFVSVFVLLALLLSVAPGAVMGQEPPPTPGVAPVGRESEVPLGGIFVPDPPKPDTLEWASDSNQEPLVVGCYSYIDDVYHAYDGYYDRGEVARAHNGKPSADVLSFEISREVGNAWNASVGVTEGMVDAEFGFDHSWSETRTFGYSATVNPYKTVHIGYKDWYHVKQFNCHMTCTTGWPSPPSTTYGTGWSSQWYLHEFYSWET